MPVCRHGADRGGKGSNLKIHVVVIRSERTDGKDPLQEPLASRRRRWGGHHLRMSMPYIGFKVLSLPAVITSKPPLVSGLSPLHQWVAIQQY